LELFELTVRFVFQRPFDGAEAVEVLHLHDRRRRDGPVRLREVQVDVSVAPQRAFLHLAVGYFQFAEEQTQFLKVG
jgi:hypothetical protein